MKYSVIILLNERPDDFASYLNSIRQTLSNRGTDYEIIIMSNGVDGFLRRIQQGSWDQDKRVRCYSFNKRTTEAVCIKAGLKESVGEVILVCGSYQQISHGSISKLLDGIDEKVDIVLPWRTRRVDPRFNQLQSKFFNALVRRITNSNLHDLSCTFRVFRRQVLEECEFYGNMYRFLPIMAARKGFRIKEVECEHVNERGKTGFYSLSEYFLRIVDVLTLYFNNRFNKQPLRFFSSLGFTFLAIGILVFAYVFFQKIFFGVPIGGRAVLLVGTLLMVIGTQIVGTGLLGEIIVFTYGRYKKEYRISKTI